jgi:hypothetical protein
VEASPGRRRYNFTIMVKIKSTLEGGVARVLKPVASGGIRLAIRRCRWGGSLSVLCQTLQGLEAC